MENTHDFAVFIGRFQPLHIGHCDVVDSALKRAKHVIILIGSSHASRSIKNPFTFAERKAMFEDVYRYEISEGRMTILDLVDRPYGDKAWIAQVQSMVNETILRVGNSWYGTFQNHGTNDFKVAMAGYKKDGTSYYLKLFPEWDEMPAEQSNGVLNSTDIRNEYFTHNPRISTNVPAVVADMMSQFMRNQSFANLVEEADFVKKYKESWANSPFPPMFVTVDAVCVQSGHILLVRRGDNPGKGLLALPGGFLNQDEYIRDAAIRELCEETEISRRVPGKERFERIPRPVLGGYINDKETRVFDYPYRSTRGRTITHAFLFELPDARPMYQVKGSDDAAWAGWVPLGELKPEDLYEDHYAIIQEMVRL